MGHFVPYHKWHGAILLYLSGTSRSPISTFCNNYYYFCNKSSITWGKAHLRNILSGLTKTIWNGLIETKRSLVLEIWQILQDTYFPKQGKILVLNKKATPKWGGFSLNKQIHGFVYFYVQRMAVQFLVVAPSINV